MVSCKKPMVGPVAVPVWALVIPGTDDAAHGRIKVFGEPEHGVAVVRVGPAADGEHRRPDRGVVPADAAVPPVVVAGLVAELGVDERVQVLQALQPHLAPALTDELLGPSAGRRNPAWSPPRRACRRLAPTSPYSGYGCRSGRSLS